MSMVQNDRGAEIAALERACLTAVPSQRIAYDGEFVVRAFLGGTGRANAASVEFNNGRVFLPRAAPWSNVVVQQLLQFPAGSFDDIVDSTSQLLIFLSSSGPMRFSTVSWGHGTSPPPIDEDHLRQQGWSDSAIMAVKNGQFRRP